MSRARKQLRDANQRGKAMGLDLNGAMAEVEKEKVHNFQFPTPDGIAVVNVSHGKMKCCPCGCDRFDMKYHVTWGKPPMLGSSPMCLRVEIYVCAVCGKELLPTHPSVEQMKMRTAIEQ